MFLYDLLLAFIIAVIISVIVSIPLRRDGVFPGIVIFFFIRFLAAWAGGTWITPFGPVWFDIYWFPFILTALIVTFLILALTSARPHRIRVSRLKDSASEDEAGIVLGCFFYLFIFFLLLAIVLSYM